MTWHLYLVPLIGTFGSYTDPPRPKYISALGVSMGLVRYGEERVVICGADVTNPQDTAIVANPDVFRIPDNLDTVLTGGTRNALLNALEADNIPASNWLNSANTYREAFRTVYGFFAFMARYASPAFHNQIAPAITQTILNTQFQNLPADVQADLIKTANSLNFDTSGLSGQNTIRQILKYMADQWGNISFNCGVIQV